MSEHYPIVVFQDRFGGAYSRGAWIAIKNGSDLVDGEQTRAQFCLIGSNGPSDSDVDPAGFWVGPPDWIAVGATPNDAIEVLKNGARPSRSARLNLGSFHS